MDRRRRIFSDEFKKEKVFELESGKISISEFSRLYEVSMTSIYKWLYRYGEKSKKGERMVIEKKSESVLRAALEARVAELERLLGQKQVEVEYLNRVIIEGEKLFGVDLKKKLEPKS